MAGRIETQKTLFLDNIDYHTFLDFIFLINDLASNLYDADIDELQEAVDQFVKKIDIVTKEED